VRVKIAVALSGAFIVGLHAPVPLQAPLQPLKTDSAAGVAVSCAVLPIGTRALQRLPQLMAVLLEPMVPAPVPLLAALKLTCVTTKLAATFCAWFIATLQLPVPLQAPLQPVKADPLAGRAVRVTTVPSLKSLLQVVPQLMPEGEDTMLPLPSPRRDVVKACVMRVKVAVTVAAVAIETVQTLALPVQAPLQPAKRVPAAGVAVSVTAVLTDSVAVQVLPQLMPADDVTEPAPVPLRLTVSVCVARVKVAPTLCAAVTLRLQLPVPLQAPVQPLKTEPAAGVAVSVAVVP
jgi:hypothetical protein